MTSDPHHDRSPRPRHARARTRIRVRWWRRRLPAAPTPARRAGRLAALALVAVSLPLTPVGPSAWAYFSSGGAGSGSAPVGTLSAPTAVAGTPSDGGVAVTWDGIGSPAVGTVGYVVTRTPLPSGTTEDVCGTRSSPLPPVPTTCTDPSAPDGTYTYAVTAVWQDWTSAATASSPVEVGPAATATALTLSSGTVAYGDEDALIATVAVASAVGGTPSGTVTVTAGGTGLCTVALPAATCSPTAADLVASDTAYPVTAVYGGDPGHAGSTSDSQGLTVTTDPDPDPDPPSIATSVLLPATEGQTGYYDVVEVDQPGPDVTWSVVSGTLPDGLSLDPATGEITGDLAPDAATETFTVQALDTAGSTDRADLTLDVDPPPLITTTSLAPAWAGEAGYSQALGVTGGAPDLTWSDTGVLPDHLTLDPSTGVISGDVAAGAVTETFAVEVSDANGFTDSETLTLDVTRTFVQERTATHTAGNASRYTVTM